MTVQPETSDPRRVLLVSHRSDRTGAPLCLLDLAQHLDRRRHIAHALLGEEGPVGESMRALGLPVEVHPRKESRGAGLILSMRRLLGAVRPDVVHLTSAVGFTKAVALAARSRRIPVVWHLHDDLRDPRFKRRKAWIRLLSQRIVACSESIAQEIPSPKTSVIENGVVLPPLPSDDQRVAARVSLGLPADATVVLYVGSFTPRKQVVPLVEAARRFKGRATNLHFVLVGGGDKLDYRTEVERARRRGGLESFVHLWDEQDDVARFYTAAHLAVLPSTMECYPRVLLEAAAAGVPTLASAVGDVPRMVTDGVSGWLHPVPESADALARALASALDEGPDAWKQKGRAARTALAERCSMDRYVSAIQSTWDDVAPRVLETTS